MEGMAHHDFFPVRVNPIVEEELGFFARRTNSPACENLSHVDDVLLRVSGIDADGVEFHHFAAVVLVQATVLLFRTPVRALHSVGRWNHAETHVTALLAHRAYLL